MLAFADVLNEGLSTIVGDSVHIPQKLVTAERHP